MAYCNSNELLRLRLCMRGNVCCRMQKYEIAPAESNMLELGVCSGHELWVQIIVKCEICQRHHVFTTSPPGERRLERRERIPGGEKCFPNSPASVSPRLAPAVRRVGLTPDIYKWHALIDRCHRNNISPHQRYVYHTSRHSTSIGSGRQPTDSRV